MIAAATGMSAEKMLDFELGYEYADDKFSFAGNIYMMEYWDMLLETGKLSDVGYAIKENVPRSWRRGVELSAGWNCNEWLQLTGNITLSTNKKGKRWGNGKRSRR